MTASAVVLAAAPEEHVPGRDMAVGTVRVALLVRQVALAAAAAVSIGHAVDPAAVAVVAALLLSSQLGLHSAAVLGLVQRHPSVALVDVLLVVAATVLVGPRHPVVLAALTSALIIGVLFRAGVAPLLVVLLLAGHLMSLRQLPDPTVNDLVGTPVVIVSFAAIGVGFRRLAAQVARQSQQAAAARQAAATAEERLRLARDVHDTVAKSVQGVALLASTLPQWIERDSTRAVAHADLVASSAREAVTEARALLTGLRAVGAEARMDAWLAERVQTWGASRDAGVGAEICPVPDLEPAALVELQAAVVETLENVDRHAPDARVEITLRTVDQLVTVVVADAGPGFDAGRPAEAVRQGRYGLLGLQERLESVGGRAEVRSVRGSGTTVTLAVPAARDADAADGSPSLRIVS